MNGMDDFPPYAHDRDTSFEAAASMVNLTGKLRTKVARFLWNRAQYGATCNEMERLLQLKHETVSARIWELHNRGFIVDSGARRLTRSDRPAVVWVLWLWGPEE